MGTIACLVMPRPNEKQKRALLERLEQAAEELGLRITVHKVKEKDASGEHTREFREAEPGGTVDPGELKKLTGALKEIREVLAVKDELQMREQEAKLRQLEWQLEGRNTGVIVKLEGECVDFGE